MCHLQHSPECPIKKGSVSNYYNKTLSTVEDNISTTSNIRVAASVIVESSDSHILLTKRTPFMRSSPNVWVTPGGHIGNTCVYQLVALVKPILPLF